MSGPLGIPWPLLTDSYKASHFELYPAASQVSPRKGLEKQEAHLLWQRIQLTAYGEFRGPFDRDSRDSRLLFYGIRYIVENYIAVKWTREGSLCQVLHVL